MGVLRLGQRVFEPEQLLVMTVVSAGDPAAMERVHAVAAEGAEAVEISGRPGADPRAEIGWIVPFIAAAREAHPELVIGVRTGQAEVARAACAAGADLLSGSGSGLAGVAAEAGAGVVCLPGSAERAAQAGVEPERIIVGLEPIRGLGELVATGWPVLISPSDREQAGSLATAALAAWLGARVFRVDQVRQARRALRMVSAIRGDIPPAYAVRGLALFARYVKRTGCRPEARMGPATWVPGRPDGQDRASRWYCHGPGPRTIRGWPARRRPVRTRPGSRCR